MAYLYHSSHSLSGTLYHLDPYSPMEFTRKKSLKSSLSYKHSGGRGSSEDCTEALPILLDHHPETAAPLLSSDREVILKIDDGDSSSGASRHRREDFDFMQRSDHEMVEDPPSKLIGQFLQKQKTSGQMALDMDLEMEELRDHGRNLPPVPETPTFNPSREIKVSFQTNSPEISNNDSFRRRYRESQEQEELRGQQPQEQRHHRRRSSNFNNNGDDQVLRCTSNASFQREASFQRRSSLLRLKTKSRLMDPPNEPDRRSGRVPKSGQFRSGLLGKPIDDEEEDPFFDEDLPDEYKRANLGVFTILQWVSLVMIMAALICTLSISDLRKVILWKLKLWKWELMILVLICGRLVSGWGIRMVVSFIEMNFLLRKRVLYFVYGIRKPVQNCLWLGLVLIVWHLLFDKRVEAETKGKALRYVTKILVCLLVGFLIWLVKTLMVKVLASSFHVSTYFDRIQESLFNQYVIETLSGPPLIEIQKNDEDEEKLADEMRKLQSAGATIPADLKNTAFSTLKSGRVIGSGGLPKGPIPPGKSMKLSSSITKKGDDQGITIDHLHKLSPKNVSAWNMKRLMNIVRHGTISTFDEQILGSTSRHEDDSATQIRSEREAKAAARKIFQNVARHGFKYIYLEDLMRFMREDEAMKAMSLFDGASESRMISKSSLKNWVVNAFRERRALALTLNDTKTAVDKLHRIVNFIISIVLIVVWLLILEIATTKFFLLASSQLVLAAFVFGNTCKTVFEAIIFLFVIHPYDVGDRCEIDGVQMIVEEMNILTTIFLRYDNQKIIYPNSVLSTKSIHNFYRSPDMGDSVEFCIHVSTPAEKIAGIRQRILTYVEGKKEHWCPNPTIVCKELEELNRVRCAVWLTHRMNHQDMGERWARRAGLVEEMVKIFRDLDIQYRLFPLDINVRSLPPAASFEIPPNRTTMAG